MDEAKFLEKMGELVELAKKHKNVLMQEDIQTFFKDIDKSWMH